MGGSGESSEDEREGRIRVGRDYQAVPPPFIPSSERRPEQCAERALLVWSPANHIAGQKLDEFIQVLFIFVGIRYLLLKYSHCLFQYEIHSVSIFH